MNIYVGYVHLCTLYFLNPKQHANEKSAEFPHINFTQVRVQRKCQAPSTTELWSVLRIVELTLAAM